VHQQCSNAVKVGGKRDVDNHRDQIRRLVAEAPDEPTYCEFKEELSYATPKDKGELVKDVSSFANADLEILGGHGYIIFGVSNDGEIVGIGSTSGDPASDARQIVNSNLGRPVEFEFVTCHVDTKTGDKKRVAAIVVPDSRRRPHVVSREIQQHLNHKDKFWLRKGEVWVRKTGGRELASADDLDTMYEGKLRRVVDEQVRPLRQRVESLERDLRERTNAVPKLGFGFALPNSREPTREVRPFPVLGNLIKADVTKVKEVVEDARKQAAETPQVRPIASSLGPTAEDYEGYARGLQEWFIAVQDRFFVDFVFANAGGAPAEDIQVILAMPAALKPGTALPIRPRKPSRRSSDRRSSELAEKLRSISPTRHPTQPRPDRIIGPSIVSEDVSDRAIAFWEIPKLYHDRPLFTRSKVDLKTQQTRTSLVISGSGLRTLQAEEDGGVRLNYTVRAANVPETLRGILILR
jgi:hypothetical protein